MEKATILHNFTAEQLNSLFKGIENRLIELKESFEPKSPTEYLTRSEVSELLKCDLSTLHNWVKKGKLNPYGIGNRIYLMKLRILYHGNCFDGVSSAAIFTKFYQSKINADAQVYYTPTMHRAGNAFDRDQFDGDENAIVDFKYCPDDRLTWWFDHHQSAFLSPSDEQHFLADTSGQKFPDITSKS